MKMVVGLGNPGRKYEHTRHNVGFDVLDELAARGRAAFRRGWLNSAETAKMRWSDEDLVLIKPQTYMNRSGYAVASLMKRRGLKPVDLIVVVDDADLEAGQLRIRKSGSAGGHNGLKSVVEQLGTEDFIRVRVGIGRSATGQDIVDHVLAKFSAEEKEVMARAVQQGADAVLGVLQDGVEKAMNKFN
jgi:PTH1 family peptidyl-tRNA hydrolase